MKHWGKAAALALSVAMVAGVGTFAGCGESSPEAANAAARMTVEINPSVEFILDSDEKVLSVTGLNDDGSLIVAGEAFVGKTADEAVKLMVGIAVDTGYLVKGEVTADENGITVSVSGDAEAADRIYQNVKGKVDALLEEKGVTAAIEKGEALKIEALRAMVMAADPTLTQAEADAMTEEQLLNALKLARIECAELLTEELRQAYRNAKEYEFAFAEKEATKNVIAGMDAAYQEVKDGYSNLLESYRNAIKEVEEARYKAFVAADSSYQKALKEVQDAKTELLKQKNVVAQMEDSAEKTAAELILKAKESAFEMAEKSLAASAAIANQAMEGVVTMMKTVEAQLTAFESQLPAEVASALTERAAELEKAMNEAKAKAFENFEEAHGEDIEAVKKALEARKQALIEANR